MITDEEFLTEWVNSTISPAALMPLGAEPLGQAALHAHLLDNLSDAAHIIHTLSAGGRPVVVFYAPEALLYYVAEFSASPGFILQLHRIHPHDNPLYQMDLAQALEMVDRLALRTDLPAGYLRALGEYLEEHPEDSQLDSEEALELAAHMIGK